MPRLVCAEMMIRFMRCRVQEIVDKGSVKAYLSAFVVASRVGFTVLRASTITIKSVVRSMHESWLGEMKRRGSRECSSGGPCQEVTKVEYRRPNLLAFLTTLYNSISAHRNFLAVLGAAAAILAILITKVTFLAAVNNVVSAVRLLATVLAASRAWLAVLITSITLHVVYRLAMLQCVRLGHGHK